MTIAQRFAQIFGRSTCWWGSRFHPGCTVTRGSHTQCGFHWGFFYTGFVLGLFAVNWLHNIIHAVIGIAGLDVYWNPTAASAYALVLGVAYLELFILGLFMGGAFDGLLPLTEWDDVLHIVTSLIALGVFFASRRSPDSARGGNSGRLVIGPSIRRDLLVRVSSTSPLLWGSTPGMVGSSVILRPILFAVRRLHGTAQLPVEAAEAVQMSSAGTGAAPNLALGMGRVTPFLPALVHLEIPVPIGPPPLVPAFEAPDDAPFVYAALLAFGTWSVLRRMRFRHRLGRCLLLE